MNYVLLILCILITALVSYAISHFILRKYYNKQKDLALDNLYSLYATEKDYLQQQNTELGTRLNQTEQNLGKTLQEFNYNKELLNNANQKLIILAKQEAEINDLKDINSQLEQKHTQILQQKQDLAQQVTYFKTKLDLEEKQSLDKINLLQQAENNLSNAFRILANDILEQKSQRFTEQNKHNINLVLEPLKLQLSEFKQKVEQVYEQEGKDRTALSEQVKSMISLNQQLSNDANNLARALKGDNKAQGNFGEMVLERILESAGLVKGISYNVQQMHNNDEGNKIQPDVIINLPDERHIVLDSKTSINAYDDYLHADDEQQKKLSLKKHINSIYSHIDNLHSKKYQQVLGDKTPDFVLMFIPLEPAFSLAINYDVDLWHKAWNKNILLVSPSNLLLIIRIISNIWKQDNKNKNAEQIAKRGGELYDKFVGFIEDMQKLETSIDKSKDIYNQAFNKFKQGKGNVIRQAQMLKELGANANKNLPSNLLDEIEIIEE